MNEHTENKDISTIDFRLNSIEKSIEELKSYVLETKLQQKDIDILHKAIEHLQQENEELVKRLDTIEKKPVSYFENITQYIAIALISGIIGYILNQIGLHI